MLSENYMGIQLPKKSVQTNRFDNKMVGIDSVCQKLDVRVIKNIL